MLSISQIEQALRSHRPALHPSEGRRRAAVALLLHAGSQGPEVLFIRRSEHPDDPWSGDLAFPGGGVEPEDASPKSAAERETAEEIGLLLQDADYLGRLDDLVGAYLSVQISCFVYLLRERPRLTHNIEVGDSFWVPLEVLLEPRRNRRAEFHYRRALRSHPTVDLSEWSPRPLWGITYRLLENFLCLFDLSFTCPEQRQTRPAEQNTRAR